MNPREPSLNDFADRLRGMNPFAIDCVSDPESDLADVEEIHGKAFRELRQLAEEVALPAHGSSGSGLVLWGEAGVGKSHLIGRFLKWCQGADGQLVYLLNLQTAAADWMAEVLRYVVHHLTGHASGDPRRTRLYAVLGRILKRLYNQNPRTENCSAKGKETFLSFAQSELGKSSRTRPRALAIYGALYDFYCHAYFERTDQAERIVQWLSGDALEEQEAQTAGVLSISRRSQGVAQIDQQTAEDILRILAHLCWNASANQSRPLILCFDQVENLGEDQIRAFTTLAHHWIDTIGHLLVVTCGVQRILEDHIERGIVTPSSKNRVFREIVQLGRITVEEARQIIQQRLDAFLAPFRHLAEMRHEIAGDPLFPLGTQWFNSFVGDAVELRPRDVITAAKRAWREQQGRLELMGPEQFLPHWRPGSTPPPPVVIPPLEELIDQKVAAKLEEHCRQRALDPDSLPPSASNLVGIILALVRHCLARSDLYSARDIQMVAKPQNGPKPPLYLKITWQSSNDSARRGGIAVLCSTSATSLAASLRHLLDDRTPIDQLFLITDVRRPLRLGEAGQRRLGELRARSAPRLTEVALGFDEYSQLDALQHVVNLAVSGDLEVEHPSGINHPVSQEEVLASLHRQGKFLSHRLLRALLSGNSPPSPSPPPDNQPAPRPGNPLVPGPLWIGQTPDSAITVTLPLGALPTHVAVVGAAGSGKTWLAKVIAEEAVRAGVPVLAIDPQGDLVQFLKAADPAGFNPDEHAAFDDFHARVEPRVFTPATSHARRLALNPIRLVSDEELTGIADPNLREEERYNVLGTIAQNLVQLARAKGDADSQRTFLYRLLDLLEEPTDSRMGLGQIVDAVLDPPSFGMEYPDRFLKRTEREGLGMKLNALVEGPASGLFTGGEPLDLDQLVTPSAPGKTPLNVIYLNALPNDEQRQFFVASLAAEIYRWMITRSAPSGPVRLLCYLDEARDYLPAGMSKPPAKDPLIRLFSQGRKFGVACLMCTQSPCSVDYNVFSNCSTKFIGRLESAQDVDRVREWFARAGEPSPEWLDDRRGAPSGSFVGRWPGMPEELVGAAWTSRPLFSLHEAAWSPDRLAEEWRAKM